MAEDQPKPPVNTTVLHIEPIQHDFPPLNFPTLYADGVSGVQPGPQVVKIYFSRLDPNLRGQSSVLTQPVAQLVMQLSGFVQMSVFFENLVKQLLEAKAITEEQLEHARQFAGAKSGDET